MKSQWTRVALLVVFIISACAGGTENRVLLNDIWVLSAMQGADFEKAELQQLRLEFKVSENQFSGHDGCNRLFGDLRLLDNAEIMFGEIGSTKVACKSGSMTQRYLELLKATRKYDIENLKLTLMDDQGAELLVFRKVD